MVKMSDVILLGCDIMWTHRYIPVFQRNVCVCLQVNLEDGGVVYFSETLVSIYEST
jgi:hypothetical protein